MKPIFHKATVCFLLLLLMGALSLTGALADGGTFGPEHVPEKIRTFLVDSPWSDWTITGWVNPAGLRCEEACAFLAVKRGSENDLLAFGVEDSAWRYLWHNAAALPQVEEPVELADNAGQGVGFASYYVFDGEIMEAHCLWALDEDGAWRLRHMYNYHPLMFADASVQNALRLYNTGWVEGEETDVWFYGAYTSDLRAFDFDRFPKTVEAAHDAFGTNTEGGWRALSAQVVEFPAGKTYAVYAGPGKVYGQAGGGKAAVSTNDWIMVFGAHHDWLLIQYEITEGRMRVGWIPASALPEGAAVEALRFTAMSAELTRNAELTDDPLGAQTSIASLPRGTRVTALATLEDRDASEDWAYIRCDAPEPVCGFVKLTALRVLVGGETYGL